MPVLTIYPYLLENTWVFDDPRTALKEEAFVLGMTEMISRLVKAKDIRNARQGFAMHFSEQPFQGFDAELTWQGSDHSQVVAGRDGSASKVSGNWYTGMVAGQKMRGWLCAALGLYFHEAPPRLFVKTEPLPDGVDPIWRVSRNDAMAVRFVSAPKQQTMKLRSIVIALEDNRRIILDHEGGLAVEVLASPETGWCPDTNAQVSDADVAGLLSQAIALTGKLRSRMRSHRARTAMNC